jgi:hypothetical protein
MKVKLKKDEKLSSMDNHCELDYDVWVSLNQGKTVELDKINKFIKDKVETVGADKKQPKKEDK